MKQLLLCLLLLTAAVTYGQDSTTAADPDLEELYWSADHEWDDWFMPGVGYKVFMPRNSEDLGVYHGFVTEFVIYARAKGKRSIQSGPSRVKVYTNLNILSSDQPDAKDLFLANLGLNLSLEGNTDRKYLIPYFGLEAGGMFQRDYGSLAITPVGGISLVSTHVVQWSVQGGYTYATHKFDEYSGPSATSTVNILLWNK